MVEGLLAEIGKRSVERWLTRVVLPGTVFVLALACALQLGWSHPFGFSRLTDDMDRLLGKNSGKQGATFLLAVELIAAGSLAGVVVDAAGRALTVFGIRIPRLAAPLLEARTSVNRKYAITMEVVWPRLWQLTPEHVRQEIQTSWSLYASAATQMVWTLPYLVLGVMWPPMLLVAALLPIHALWKAKVSLDAFAETVEAAVDLTIRPLADSLGIALRETRVTRADGPEITTALTG